jgi:hypothetical protein
MKKKKGSKSMNMSLAEIEKHLKTLRLHGMNATLQTRLVQANQGASFVEVFACLVQDELDCRNYPPHRNPLQGLQPQRAPHADRI